MLQINKNPEHILVDFGTGFPHKSVVSLLVEGSEIYGKKQSHTVWILHEKR